MQRKARADVRFERSTTTLMLLAAKSNEPLRILVVAPLFAGSTSCGRRDAFRSISPNVQVLDSCDYFPNDPKMWPRLQRRLRWGPLVTRWNARLRQTASQYRPDLIWLEKALLVTPETVESLKKCCAPGGILAHYSPDDQMNERNRSRHYERSISIYDVHVTTKTLNVAELLSQGAKRVIPIISGYSSTLHRPIAPTTETRLKFGAEVGFIGGFESERAASIMELGRQGVRVRVWGPGWQKLKSNPELQVEGHSIWGEDYVSALCSTDINLCFLRKENRDVSTSRTFEIPACGAFMLAERTDAHRSYFLEDREACFFASNNELVEKVRHFTDHHGDRTRIAAAGRQRCLASGYSNEDIFRNILTAPWVSNTK